MKKITLGLLVVVLFVPAVVLAEQNEDSARPARAGERINLEELRGEIISLSKNEVTIASGTEDNPEQIKIRIPERRSQLRGLLAQGLGHKAELQCRKTSQGVLTLARIAGIEGVDVGRKSGFGRRVRGNLADRAKNLSPEQREQWRDRFMAMGQHLKDNPEIREELRELAKDDPEAFRKRIREMMPGVHSRQGPGGLQRNRGIPGMPGQQIGARGDQSRHRFFPESEEVQKLERQSHKLARQYRQAEGTEKQQMQEELRATLLQIFEKKTQHQNEFVEHLEKQLQKLRSRLENRQKNRDAIVDRRFEQLTSDGEDELAW